MIKTTSLRLTFTVGLHSHLEVRLVFVYTAHNLNQDQDFGDKNIYIFHIQRRRSLPVSYTHLDVYKRQAKD